MKIKKFKEPKTMRGKLTLLICVSNMTAEYTGTEQENSFLNNIVGFIQNELGDLEGQEILKKYNLQSICLV